MAIRVLLPAEYRPLNLATHLSWPFAFYWHTSCRCGDEHW